MFFTSSRRVVLIVLITVLCVILGVTAIWIAVMPNPSIVLELSLGLMFTLSIAVLVWQFLDPDSNAAQQSAKVLQLASQSLDCIKEGLTAESAQQICELLLPATPAMAVAITDRAEILGYAGYNSKNNRAGTPIRTTATHEVLADGQPRILHNTLNIGLPSSSARISAAIIQPIFIGRNICGTLKFYYRSSNKISETQKSLAQGFAELISTQLAAAALEEQTMLATSMELKALQAQINPHFLFNTINTIAALIRTNPDKARILLREFAVFYRSMLEDAEDLISLEREIKQVQRYFLFEVARFGEERLELQIQIEDEAYNMLVPSFMIQPLVENSVRHGLGAEGKLTVCVTAKVVNPNIVITVEDDGIGMDEETLSTMMDKGSTTGLGIAVKNVKERMRAYYGPEARMDVQSHLGEGTIVTFTLNKDIASSGYLESVALDVSSISQAPRALSV